MALAIEDYALIGDTRTAALVGPDGSIDWWCVPRFDSSACFAALLGGPEHGRWKLAPETHPTRTRRRYRAGTLVLETEFETEHGSVRVTDCMPQPGDRSEVVGLVDGLRGRVAMSMELVARFDYGRVVPWVRRLDGAVSLTAGPDSLLLRTPVETYGEDFTTQVPTCVRRASTRCATRSPSPMAPGRWTRRCC
jgi:GH15 family glucan-1,4-alpha-glucosidase